VPPRPLLALILAAVGCGLPASDSGLASEAGTACIDAAEDATTCPDAADVDVAGAFVPVSCDEEEVISVSGVGELAFTDQMGVDLGCCYAAQVVDPTPGSDCDVGRPFHEGHRAVVSGVVPRDDWGGAALAVPTRSAPADPTRAAAWARAGVAEHASIAAFSKLALELLAHGAPAALVRKVHAAGLDEIDHAERCFALAARFGGVAVGPGAFPFTAPIDAARPLAALAADAVREGCVGETVGAVLARAAASSAPDPDVRAALAAIAADEERHAALSWEVVAWALRVGGPSVKVAVTAAFAAPVAPIDVAGLALRAGVDGALLVAAGRGGIAEVVRPAAAVLTA
jgi:hypothetical protein